MKALSVRKSGVGAADGEVVDRAVHGERADVAAGKFQRLHGEAVGGDAAAIAGAERQRRRVEADIERRIGEMAREDLLDQFAHEAAAVAVGER